MKRLDLCKLPHYESECCEYGAVTFITLCSYRLFLYLWVHTGPDVSLHFFFNLTHMLKLPLEIWVKIESHVIMKLKPHENKPRRFLLSENHRRMWGNTLINLSSWLQELLGILFCCAKPRVYLIWDLFTGLVHISQLMRKKIVKNWALFFTHIYCYVYTYTVRKFYKYSPSRKILIRRI